MAKRWDAMTVREYTDGQGAKRSDWTKVGAAFENANSGTISIQLDAIPITGKIILQVPMSREEREAKAQARQAAQGADGRGGRFGGPRGDAPPAPPPDYPDDAGASDTGDDDIPF
jgi:hypothetical protein